MKRMGLAGVALAVVFLTMAGSAWAEATATICVPESSSKQVLSTNTKGECPSKTISKVVVKYKSEALPGPAELAKLDKLLPHVNYVESGIGGKPTIQFSGANVQIVNGSGQTETPNGAGNLVLGYDEKPGTQTGSHNLILAGIEDSFTSWGGILAGSQSQITGGFSSVLSGDENSASKDYSVVVTGAFNTASGPSSAVGGGSNNTASGPYSSIFGGFGETATEEYEAKP